MKKRREQANVFGMSFLDLAFCTLGGVVLLLIHTINRRDFEATEFENLRVELQDKIENRDSELQKYTNQIDDLQKQIDSRVTQIGNLDKQISDLKKQGEDADRDFRQQIAKLEKASNSLKQQAKDLGQDKQLLQNKLDDANEKFAKLKSESDKKIAMLNKDLVGANDAMKGALTKSDKEKAALKKEWNEDKEKFANKMKMFGDLETKLKMKVAMLEKQYRGANEEKLAAIENARKQKIAHDVKLGDIRKALTASQKDLDALQFKIQGVVGLKGKFKNVAFIFDSSASLALAGGLDTPENRTLGTQRFQEYKTLLAGWLTVLPFEKLMIIDFDNIISVPQAWKDSPLVDATPGNRAAAVAFVNAAKADGTTNTYGAFEKALAYPDIDTIVFFSDGAPNNQENKQPVSDEEIKEAIKWNLDNIIKLNSSRANPVVINSIAIGEYLNKSYGEFLRDLAKKTDGQFLGR